MTETSNVTAPAGTHALSAKAAMCGVGGLRV